MGTEAHLSDTDRRRRRSAYLPNAVKYQLQHVLDVLELEAIVLADDLGIPVAFAGDERLATLLADSALWTDRHGPRLDPMIHEEINRSYRHVRDVEVATKVLELPGPSAFWRLSAVGRSCARYVGLEHAEAGIRRILGSTTARRMAAAT